MSQDLIRESLPAYKLQAVEAKVSYTNLLSRA